MKFLPWIGVFFAGLVLGILVGAVLVGKPGEGQATPTPTATEAPVAPTATAGAMPVSTPMPASTAISASPPQGKVGQVAPDFVLKDLGGQEVKLYDSRGKIVVLVFWKDADPDSLAMMPYLSEFYQEHQDDPDLQVLSINSGSLLDVVKPLAEASRWLFPILLDEGLQQTTQYDVAFWPTTFFLDREGIIQGRIEGLLTTDQLNEKVDTLR